MIKNFIMGLVEFGRQMTFGNGEADGIGNALSQGSGTDFDTCKQIEIKCIVEWLETRVVVVVSKTNISVIAQHNGKGSMF